jgi:hypothetical protein
MHLRHVGQEELSLTIVLIVTFGRDIRLIELARSKQFHQALLISVSIPVLGVLANARAKTIVPVGHAGPS